MYHSREHEERGCTRNSVWAMIVASINKPALSVRNGTKQKKTKQILQVLNVAMKLTTHTQLDLTSPDCIFSVGVYL